MADVKISALTAASAAAMANEIEINEAGSTKKLTVAQIATLFGYDVAFVAGFDSSMVKENIAVATYGEMVMARAGSFVGEAGYIDTVATGAAAIVDILKNGTTIYTTKPQFAISTATLTAGTLKTDGTEDFVSGDRITFKVTQIGSTIAGQGVRFTLKGNLT